MGKYTKADQIKDLIIALNELRAKENKKPVVRAWTGLAHWLSADSESDYGVNMIGQLCFSDKEFISHLQGLLYRD